MIIERARREDRKELADMYAADLRTLGSTWGPDDLLSLVDQSLGEQGCESHTFVARTADGLIAGVALTSPFLSLKVAGRSLWIEELYVRPDFRRQGIARMLVEHLLDWAEGAGFKGVELEAYHMNAGASILYRSLGFRRLARERYCYCYGLDDDE